MPAYLPTWARRVFSTTKVARRRPESQTWGPRSGVAAGPRSNAPQQRGFVALGTPTPEYVRAWGAERLEAEDKKKTRCFASFPSCLIFSARGSSSASARHPVPTMHSGLFLPTFSRRTLQHVMQPYGAPFKLVWAPLRRTRHAPLGTSPCSRLALAGWDYRRPRAPARRPIGRPGPMPSVCCANGARPSRTGRSAASLTPVDQPACGQLLKHAGC